MREIFYFRLAAFLLDYFAAFLIFIFGLNRIKEGLKKDNKVLKEFDVGLGLFFISFASSALIYLSDLMRELIFDGKRIFPRGDTFSKMGLEFASFHHQVYFIILMSFILISLFFLMRPIEIYMQQKEKSILSYICLVFTPLPSIIKVLEILTLPQEDSMLYYIYSALYIMIWLVIGISILTLLGLYLKVIMKSGGSVRRNALYVFIGIFLWVLTFFARSTFFKSTIEDYPYLFWLLPVLEILIIYLFSEGFSQLEEKPKKGRETYLYQNWFFKTFIVGFTILIGIYFTFYFSLPADNYINLMSEVLLERPTDLSFIVYFQHLTQINNFWYRYGLFFDDSATDLLFNDFDQYVSNGFILYGQDITYLILLICLLLYFVKPKSKKYTGFIIASAIVLAITNRAFKAFFARARPGAVLSGEYEFSYAWLFGSYPLSKAFSNGSFTSGHTTTAVILVALAFILIKTHSSWKIILGFGVTITWSLMMGFGRIASQDHYPTDTIWAVIIGLGIITWLYFMVFKIPEQETGEYVLEDRFVELKWGILFVFLAVFALLTLLGVKYLFLDFEYYWIAAVIIGPIFSYLIWKKMSELVPPMKNHVNSAVA